MLLLFSKIEMVKAVVGKTTKEKITPKSNALLSQTTLNPRDGALKSMAVLYQNCDALNAPPLSLDFNLKGVRPDPRPDQVHIDVPSERFNEVNNPKAFVEKHPYIKNLDPAAGCVDLRSKPPVYDFGGVPFFDVGKNQLNLHRDAGTGGKDVIGVDCSAFVAASLMAAGFKLSTNPVDLSPQQFDFFDSGQFMRAPTGRENKARGRMDCLEPISIDAKETLRAGDVIAWKGHVVMVDEVGADPLAIEKAKTLEECEKLSVQNFNFTVIQSTGANNAIGVVRSHANEIFERRYYKDAKTGDNKGGAELEKLAREVCRAKFKSSVSKILLQNAYVGVTRHRNLIPNRYSAQCAMEAVTFSNQDCVKQCVLNSRSR